MTIVLQINENNARLFHFYTVDFLIALICGIVDF